MKHKKEWSMIREHNTRRNIGVFSLHPHAGATYISVLLAEYLSNIIGFKTAVIESSLKSDLFSLQSQAKSPTDNEFELHQITYYCAGNNLRRIDQPLHGFDCYVYDLGSSYAKAREMIQACDLTIILFTMTPWYCDMTKLTERLAKDYGDKKNLCLIGNQIPARLKKKLYDQLHCEFLEFEPNLFQPSLEAVRLFHHILW